MRILVDMTTSPKTAQFLRGLGHHVDHASDLGLARASDEVIVEWAKAEGLTILTEDLDFGAILAVTGEVEPGIIILRVGNWRTEQIEDRLRRIFDTILEERFRSTIVTVERSRVRFRRLPIRSENPP